MKKTLRNTFACLAWALSLAAFAQTTPAPASSAGTVMLDMPGMAHAHAGHAKPVAKTGKGRRESTPQRTTQHVHAAAQRAEPMPMAMPGMDHPVPAPQPVTNAGEAMPGMEMPPHAASAPMDHGEPQTTHAMHAMHEMDNMDNAYDMSGMHDMRMQGGAAPADARGADYSAGAAHGAMPGMDMLDTEPLGMLRFDQLEAFHDRAGNGQRWELQGWYGTDTDKLWLRSEGEHETAHGSEGDIEALWSHAVAAYWDAQLGVRHDFGGGPARDWVAFGVEGLAPYWFELSATAYAGSSGHTAARLRIDYELLFTQRLILQPELEVNAYGKADPQRGIGAGVSDASLGLRLRYEIRRQFAPYVGVQWVRRFGATAGHARAAGKPASGPQWVAGVRFWF